jgi:hypothetical protein
MGVLLRMSQPERSVGYFSLNSATIHKNRWNPGGCLRGNRFPLERPAKRELSVLAPEINFLSEDVAIL